MAMFSSCFLGRCAGPRPTRSARAGSRTRPAACRAGSATAPPPAAPSPDAAAANPGPTRAAASEPRQRRRTGALTAGRPGRERPHASCCPPVAAVAPGPSCRPVATGDLTIAPARGCCGSARQPARSGSAALWPFEAVDAVPDLPHRRRGHVRAVTGIRDHHDHHVLGVVARRERGEHRGGLLAVDLGGAGLARHAALFSGNPANAPAACPG